IFLSVVLKLNKVIAIAFSNISLAPLIPLILFLSIQMGDWMLGVKTTHSMENLHENFDMIQNLKSYLLGSITLSITAAILFGFSGFVIFSLFDRKKVLLHE